ncbi:MAG TPA: hypothetical protein VLM85_14910, partial [Polyangiaceae bacterium]|nr:hypothetical protein [Polyangiaceae bacterium]
MALAVLQAGACNVKQPPSATYFSTTILPILNASCVRTNTGAGCHVSDAKGNALGNLDVSSYDTISKRRDLLLNYGPYGQPALLVKNVPPFAVTVQSFDGTTTPITTDIKHTGGPILDPTATGYLTLRQWMGNGATENNTGAVASTVTLLPCTATVPPADPINGFDPTKDPTSSDFQQFSSNVVPVFKAKCAASNCHGTSANDLYLTCGDTPEQIRWNYFASTQYLAGGNNANQAASELVRRPLAPSQGGAFHEGGVVFQTTGDGDYQTLLSWANAHGPLDISQIAANQPNFMFFVHRIQPVLVKKGCMMVQCHSAPMFHEYRLQGGSGGAFSLSASRHNYKLSIEQLAMETDDINVSRLVRKNLYRHELDPAGAGLAHRGGPLFEDFAGQEASGALCDAQTYDYDNDPIDKIPSYCLVREWHRRERADAMAGKCNGGPCTVTDMSGIVYVKLGSNPPAPDGPFDFDAFQGGAQIHIRQASIDASGNVVLGTDQDVTSGCGLGASADIRRPTVSWDGKKIAFAARASASDPLQIYEMNADGSGCAKHTGVDDQPASLNGLPIDNFDPVYTPADANGDQSIVYATTRGNDPNAWYAGNFDYSGPQRMPADPTKANPNLYIWEPDPANPGKFHNRELTFQLDLERYPSIMTDGRIIMTAEKREPGFYQLALRRLNVDGGDYHPLYAQRSSIGFHEATQVVDLADHNFVTVFSNAGWAHQGGVLGIFNRSLGVDYYGTDAKHDYLIDPSVIDPNAPASVEPSFFLHSLTFVDGNGALVSENGQPVGTVVPASYSQNGVYRSPSALPNGKILVSWAAASDPTSFDATTYGLYVVDPVVGGRTALATGGIVDAAPIYGRYNHGTFRSAIDEPNGNTQVEPGHTEANITVLNMTVLASLLFQNTPTGRPVEDVDANGNDVGFDSFDVYEELPPTSDVTSFGAGGNFVASDDYGQVYVRRRKLGTVSLQPDKSTIFEIPGGVPIVLKAPETTVSKQLGLPRYQKEEMSFYPGEYSHQSFRKELFNSLCG